MNILVPDSWLREFLKTKATPKQIKECLSLCGPSVDRIKRVGTEVVYEIEITSNRPDLMSVAGIAREASAILPCFGLKTSLISDLYRLKFLKGSTLRSMCKIEPSKRLKLAVKTDSLLNPRWTSVVFEKVKIGPSPDWLKKRLELVGVRALNNVIDVTNYLLKTYGQPAHVFDYDAIKGHTMILRASKKNEKLTTLDGKTHHLTGDDIVIADGSGKLIDLCGIMGGQNSAVQPTSQRIILFLQTYEPARIRRTMMTLGHRSDAGTLFEKGLDPELVLPVFREGIELVKKLTGGKIAGEIIDLYPSPYQPPTVKCSRQKLNQYLGKELSAKETKNMLHSLGFQLTLTEKEISAKVPSFRRDVSLDVDIIEEIARIYGFHNLPARLPDKEPPVVIPAPIFRWEEEIKIRLRDWGFTEVYTYSMISEELMDTFGLDKTKTYKITNPLSNEWVYLRPHLFPSVLEAVKQNLKTKDDLKIFELSMAYCYRENDLPLETPTLIVIWTGKKFLEAKGLAESIFKIFGIDFPDYIQKDNNQLSNVYGDNHLILGDFGSLGEINNQLISKMGITKPITRLYLDFTKLVAHAKPVKRYHPLPKYPPIVEDLAFVVPENFEIGPLASTLKKANPLVIDVSLLDIHENTRTLHITYQDPNRNLTNEDIKPIREKLIKLATEKFSLSLKTVD